MPPSISARPAGKVVIDKSHIEEDDDDLHINTGIALDEDHVQGSGSGNDLAPRLLSHQGRQPSFVSDTEDDDEASERPLRRELYIPGTDERYGYISVPEAQEAADRANLRAESLYSHHGNPSTDSIPPLAHNTAFLESQQSLNAVPEYLDAPQAQSPPKPSFWPYPEFKSLYTASPELRDVAEMHSRAATPAEVPLPPFSEQPTEDIVKVFIDARNELAARKNNIVSESPVGRARDPGHGDLKQSDVNVLPDGAEIAVPNEAAFREERGDGLVGVVPMPVQSASPTNTSVKSPPIPTRRPATIKSLQRNAEHQPTPGTLRHQRRTSLSPDRSSPLAKSQPIQAEPELENVELTTSGAESPVETKAETTEEASLAQSADKASQQAENTLKEVHSNESAEGGVKEKPAPPPRPNKFSSLRSQFVKTLDAQLQKGPTSIKKAEPEPLPSAEGEGLSDLRKSRARGPKRRPNGPVPTVKSWSATPVRTWFEVSSDPSIPMEGEEPGDSGLVMGTTFPDQGTQLKRYITLEEVLKREKGGQVHTDDAGRIYIHDPMNEDATLWLDDSYNGEEIYIRSKIGIE